MMSGFYLGQDDKFVENILFWRFVDGETLSNLSISSTQLISTWQKL